MLDLAAANQFQFRLTTDNWLDLLTPLTPADSQQRENQSQFGPDHEHRLDPKESDAVTREIWDLVENTPAQQ